MLITLVRHGNTDANRERWLQGQMDTQLNETGKRQAELVGQRLAKEQFDVIYCSDLSRCTQTAAGITNYHGQTPIFFDKRLREHDFGKLNGQPVTSIKANAKRLRITEEQFIIDQGGESDQEVKSRVLEAFNDIVGKSQQAGHSHILIVSHGGPLGIIVSWMVEEQTYELPANAPRIFKLGNTSVTRALITGCSGRIEQFNCLTHLADMLDTSLQSDRGPAV
ncbi:histidine phosphatase superfamily [Umbelopsis sp. PMI_123]|nr:histidine phosphatase superfamily [Umbelopsis sp. PMI_123]